MKEESPKQSVPVHPKTAEYVERIKAGEDAEKVTQGLPERLKQDVLLRSEKDNRRIDELKQKLGMENILDNPSIVVAKRKILNELSKKEIDFTVVTKILRDGLTTRSSFAEMMEKDETLLANGFEKERTEYRARKEDLEKCIEGSDMKWESNPAWFGINTVPEKVKTKEINRKFYATISTESTEFVDHIPKLAEELRELALKTDDIIQIKLPNTYSGFISHRDSIVIHFKDPNNEGAVKDIFQKWIQFTGTKEDERELGRTQVAADSRETSFSDLVATTMVGYLKDNLGKYDTDALLNKTLEHAAELSKKGPTIEKK